MEVSLHILLIGTLIVIFFAVFFREAPEFLKNKTILYGFIFLILMFFERITQIFEGSKSCIDRICGNS
jgi:hypothetical protein